MHRVPPRALLAALVVLLSFAAPAAAQTGDPGKPPFDSRDDERVRPQAPDDPAAVRAIDRLGAGLGRQGVVDLDARTGTPRFVGRLDGFLTGPSGDDPAAIVLGYVRALRPVFRLSEADIDGLRLVRRYRDHEGTTHIEWAQTWRGIAAFDNGLQAAVASDGRLINVSGSPLPGLGARSDEPAINAREALAKALGDAGRRGMSPRQQGQHGADRRTTFTGGHDARLILFAARRGDVHLAWRVTANAGDAELYDHVIDADTGEVLFRDNKVDFADGKVHAHSYHPVDGTRAEHTVPVDSTTRLLGPNAYVYADLNDSDTADGGEHIPPSSLSPLSWNYPSDSKERSGSQLYYLVNEFHDWLKAPPFSFDAASGGFEGVNDRVIAETRDGAGLPQGPRNNAFMSTPPQGQSPRMSMFLWTNTTPARDSSEDASVVFHEYTHGLSNRLITDPAGEGALYSPQSAAMGEGWSDWYALDYLADPTNGPGGANALDPDTSAPGELLVAEYVNPGGIRSEPLDCPRGDATGDCDPGGDTYGSFGRVADLHLEHRNGEIWAQTLWDLRDEIGPDAARRVITGGMRLAPDNPSMLEMRNTILQAAAPAERAQIWSVFANRGMGYFAVSYRGTDGYPRESFAEPGGETTVSGRVTDAQTGAPVAGALVRLASTATGFPGDLTAVTASDGGYRIDGVLPGTYPRPLVDAPGYSPGVAADVAVPSSGRTLDLQLTRSWASAAGGAKVGGFTGPDYAAQGCGPGGAIDSSYLTGWGSSSHNPPTAANLPGGAKAILIALPQAVDVSAFNVDPAETCGDDSSAATGRYRIETSSDGQTFTVAASGEFTSANNHRANVIAAPGGTTGVRWVRYTMLTPQSQGAGHAGVYYMDTSEIEVYGAATPPPSSAPSPGAPATQPAPVVPTVTGGGTAIAAVDGAAPTARLALRAGQRIKTALSKGLKVTVSCNEACSARLNARLDAKTAKKLKLLPRRSRAKSVVVASGTLRMGEGRRTVTLKFTRKAKKYLKRQRRLKLAVTGSVSDRAGNQRSSSRSITLKR